MAASTIRGGLEESLFGIARKKYCSVDSASFIDTRLLCLSSVYVVPRFPKHRMSRRKPRERSGRDEYQHTNVLRHVRPLRDALEVIS